MFLKTLKSNRSWELFIARLEYISAKVAWQFDMRGITISATFRYTEVDEEFHMRHHYFEAPNEYTPKSGEQSLFLAGGITDCPNWQGWMIRRLSDSGLVLLNPRRANFPVDDPDAALAQIAWEHRHLRIASGISFWFCAETLNPIVLYELGAWSMTNKPIFVGIEPGYERTQDVEIQTELVRPNVKIVYDLEELAAQVLLWERQQPKPLHK